MKVWKGKKKEVRFENAFCLSLLIEFWVQRPSFTQLREHLTQLFKDLQQQRQASSSHEPVQFHSHATVPVDVAGSSRKRGEVQGSC